MKAFIFPGQGSQSVGMAREFHNEFKIVKSIFEEADDNLKFNLSKIILKTGTRGSLIKINLYS